MCFANHLNAKASKTKGISLDHNISRCFSANTVNPDPATTASTSSNELLKLFKSGLIPINSMGLDDRFGVQINTLPVPALTAANPAKKPAPCISPHPPRISTFPVEHLCLIGDLGFRSKVFEDSNIAEEHSLVS